MKNTLEFLKRFGFIIFNTILFIFLAVMFARAQGVEVKNSLRLIDIDQPNKAIELLSKAVSEHPDDAILHYYIGYAQLQAGEYALAFESFEKGLVKNDKQPLFYVGKGHVLLLKKNTTEAKSFFDRALAMSKSKNVAVLQAIARAYLSEPKFSGEALALLEKANLIEPNNAETYLLLGDAYLLQNNGGSAVSNYEWAAQYDPKNAKPPYKIGVVYLRTKDYKIAEESFLKAISIDPGYARAFKELGELSYLSKNGTQAVKYYETYLLLTEKPEKDKLRYAFFLFMARDFTKANEVFRELVQKEDVNPITLRYYAFSLFEAGDYQQSRGLFEKYFTNTRQEFNASDYGYYGKLLTKLNEDSLASINLEKSLALDKNQAELTRLLAETQLKHKKYQKSIELYKQLIGSHEKPLSQDYYSIGRAYYFNSQYANADSSFLKLIELQPNMVVGYLWEARTKSNLDPESEKGLAKPFYEKLIEIASINPDKSKNDLIEAYSYLGYYHFLKEEMRLSKSYWMKVLALNPNHEKAKEAIKAIH